MCVDIYASLKFLKKWNSVSFFLFYFINLVWIFFYRLEGLIRIILIRSKTCYFPIVLFELVKN